MGKKFPHQRDGHTTNKAHDKIEIVVSRDKNGDVNSHYLKRVKEK